MIKSILDVIRSHRLMSQVEQDVSRMMDLAEMLARAASAAVIDGRPVDFDLYAKDREINLLVVNTRKRIMEHLSVSAVIHPVGELVLLTLINNVERIGDHSKNMFDLYRRLDGPIEESFYLPILKNVNQKVLGFFPKARKALFDDDEAMAREVMDGHLVVVKAAKGLTSDLLYDEEILARQAVAIVVVLRSLKRISSHLKTISSSTVSPFMMLGFTQMPEVDKGFDDDE